MILQIGLSWFEDQAELLSMTHKAPHGLTSFCFSWLIKLLPCPHLSLLIKEHMELYYTQEVAGPSPLQVSLSNMPSLDFGPDEPSSWTLGVPTSISPSVHPIAFQNPGLLLT